MITSTYRFGLPTWPDDVTLRVRTDGEATVIKKAKIVIWALSNSRTRGLIIKGLKNRRVRGLVLAVAKRRIRR
jgi:hypothetical protein